MPSCTTSQRAPQETPLYQLLQEHLASFLRDCDEREHRSLPNFVRKALTAHLRCGILAHGFARYLGAVHRIVIRAMTAHYRRRAIQLKLVRSTNVQTGFVTFIQRFGSSLNLNLHFHMRACDGVFEMSGAGDIRFVPLPAPSKQEVQALVETIHVRVMRLLYRRGVMQDDDASDPLYEQSPQLAACYSAAIRHTSGLTHPGRRLLRFGNSKAARKPFERRGAHGHSEGFDLHANLTVPGHDRAQLERLLRYVNRPALSNERLKKQRNGRYAFKRKTRWHDGTTHLDLHPHEILEKLAALVPKPRKNLVHYCGVLAPNHKWRKQVTDLRSEPKTGTNTSWAELMRRSFDADPLKCPKCSSQMRFVASILEHKAIARILRHLGMKTDPPMVRPARPPPQTDIDFGDVA